MSARTIKETIPEYLAHLKSQGKKESTRYTVNLNLNLMVKHFGEGKEVAKILPAHVSSFFKSDLATTVHGRPRSEPTILQIKRITRQFLVWANEQGYISSIPLPADEKRFLKAGPVTIPQGEVN